MSFEDYASAVKIDDCHAELIYGLIVSQKPTDILELGFGCGHTAKVILRGLQYNGKESNRYLIVDNWMDHDRKMPVQAASLIDHGIQFVTSEERDYIASCKETFDFILSDADHQHTNEWMEQVYQDKLRPGGILIYHDVMGPEYPNLFSIVTNCRNRGISHVVFNENSRPEERCDRGLLVIFKPQ